MGHLFHSRKAVADHFLLSLPTPIFTKFIYYDLPQIHTTLYNQTYIIRQMFNESTKADKHKSILSEETS